MSFINIMEEPERIALSSTVSRTVMLSVTPRLYMEDVPRFERGDNLLKGQVGQPDCHHIHVGPLAGFAPDS